MASEVTPEGYINTGFGELMFFVGNPPEPVHQRIKTLDHGYLPIVQYSFIKNDVRYSFSVFTADLGDRLAGLPVNFIRVQLQNVSDAEETAFLSSAFRCFQNRTKLFKPDDYRFNQRFDLIPKDYTQGRIVFDPIGSTPLSATP